MKPSLFIVGAGGHGRELNSYIADLIRAGPQIRFAGFLDDHLSPGTHAGLHVLGPVDCLQTVKISERSAYITACGDNRLRRQMVARIESNYGDRLRPWTLVHPLAIVGCGSQIGEGSCLAPGSITTANARIGRHVILNVKASVSHDCDVGDFANINPGATVCGCVRVGEAAYIGAGAVLKDRVSIGPWAVVGAGAVVIRDVPPHATVVGVPARVIRQNAECTRR